MRGIHDGDAPEFLLAKPFTRGGGALNVSPGRTQDGNFGWVQR